MKGLASNRIGRISQSQTLEMANKANELKMKGVDVINLSIGQPDFETPHHIKKAAKAAIDENYTFYTPIAGFEELREAICLKLKSENNLNYSPSQVVVSNGAKQALANTLLSIINEGDQILVPAPYWVSYAQIDNLAHGENVFIDTTIENDFKVTPEQIEKAITPSTRAFLFSSPSNPAGSVYTRDELEAIARVLAKHEIFVISDEIYERINFVGKHESIAQFDFIKDHTIIINGMSKGYAMTGWRIGYLVAPQWIADSCRKLQGQYTSNACSISQKAAFAALTGEDTYTLGMNAAFHSRRDIVVEGLRAILGVKTNIPNGAFYIFPDVSTYYGKTDGKYTINNSNDMSLYLLEIAHVAIVPGSAFGNDNCIRLSFAASNRDLKKGIKRIRTALARLRQKDK